VKGKSNLNFEFEFINFLRFFKEKFPAINGDLVNSYHLLLCCLNFIYINILAINRNDLFNHQLDVKKSDLQIFDENFLNDFDGYKEDESDKNIDTNQSINLIIDYLCLNYDGLLIETKTINEHYFKTHLKYLIFKKILSCSSISFLGLFDQSSFEANR
jgi:retinoblastoma-like protein 1